MTRKIRRKKIDSEQFGSITSLNRGDTNNRFKSKPRHTDFNGRKNEGALLSFTHNMHKKSLHSDKPVKDETYKPFSYLHRSNSSANQMSQNQASYVSKKTHKSFDDSKVKIRHPIESVTPQHQAASSEAEGHQKLSRISKNSANFHSKILNDDRSPLRTLHYKEKSNRLQIGQLHTTETKRLIGENKIAHKIITTSSQSSSSLMYRPKRSSNNHQDQYQRSSSESSDYSGRYVSRTNESKTRSHSHGDNHQRTHHSSNLSTNDSRFLQSTSGIQQNSFKSQYASHNQKHRSSPFYYNKETVDREGNHRTKVDEIENKKKKQGRIRGKTSSKLKPRYAREKQFSSQNSLNRLALSKATKQMSSTVYVCDKDDSLRRSSLSSVEIISDRQEFKRNRYKTKRMHQSHYSEKAVEDSEKYEQFSKEHQTTGNEYSRHKSTKSHVDMLDSIATRGYSKKLNETQLDYTNKTVSSEKNNSSSQYTDQYQSKYKSSKKGVFGNQGDRIGSLVREKKENNVYNFPSEGTNNQNQCISIRAMNNYESSTSHITQSAIGKYFEDNEKIYVAQSHSSNRQQDPKWAKITNINDSSPEESGFHIPNQKVQVIVRTGNSYTASSMKPTETADWSTTTRREGYTKDSSRSATSTKSTGRMGKVIIKSNKASLRIKIKSPPNVPKTHVHIKGENKAHLHRLRMMRKNERYRNIKSGSKRYCIEEDFDDSQESYDSNDNREYTLQELYKVDDNHEIHTLGYAIPQKIQPQTRVRLMIKSRNPSKISQVTEEKYVADENKPRQSLSKSSNRKDNHISQNSTVTSSEEDLLTLYEKKDGWKQVMEGMENHKKEDYLREGSVNIKMTNESNYGENVNRIYKNNRDTIITYNEQIEETMDSTAEKLFQVTTVHESEYKERRILKETNNDLDTNHEQLISNTVKEKETTKSNSNIMNNFLKNNENISHKTGFIERQSLISQKEKEGTHNRQEEHTSSGIVTKSTHDLFDSSHSLFKITGTVYQGLDNEIFPQNARQKESEMQINKETESYAISKKSFEAYFDEKTAQNSNKGKYFDKIQSTKVSEINLSNIDITRKELSQNTQNMSKTETVYDETRRDVHENKTFLESTGRPLRPYEWMLFSGKDQTHSFLATENNYDHQMKGYGSTIDIMKTKATVKDAEFEKQSKDRCDKTFLQESSLISNSNSFIEALENSVTYSNHESEFINDKRKAFGSYGVHENRIEKQTDEFDTKFQTETIQSSTFESTQSSISSNSRQISSTIMDTNNITTANTSDAYLSKTFKDSSFSKGVESLVSKSHETNKSIIDNTVSQNLRLCELDSDSELEENLTIRVMSRRVGIEKQDIAFETTVRNDRTLHKKFLDEKAFFGTNIANTRRSVNTDQKEVTLNQLSESKGGSDGSGSKFITY